MVLDVVLALVVALDGNRPVGGVGVPAGVGHPQRDGDHAVGLLRGQRHGVGEARCG